MFNYFTDDFEISVRNNNLINKKSFYEYEEDNVYFAHNPPNQRGGNPLYKGVTNIKVSMASENTIYFEVISMYCSDKNLNYPKNEECSVTKDVSNKFIIQKQNQNWKIKYFVLPN